MKMTRTEVIAALTAIERILNDRGEVWREVVDSHGNVVRTIYRGAFRNDARGGESDEEET